MSLKNFIVDRVIKQKTKKTRINVRTALLQNLSIFFSDDTSINRKILNSLLSFNFHCISTKKLTILSLLKAG